jgi:hypothetical protein
MEGDRLKTNGRGKKKTTEFAYFVPGEKTGTLEVYSLNPIGLIWRGQVVRREYFKNSILSNETSNPTSK